MLLLAFMVTVAGLFVPMISPLQPTNWKLECGVAVTLICWPRLYLSRSGEAAAEPFRPASVKRGLRPTPFVGLVPSRNFWRFETPSCRGASLLALTLVMLPKY